MGGMGLLTQGLLNAGLNNIELGPLSRDSLSYILNIGAGGYAGIFSMMKTGGLTELYGQNRP